jgi:hypothetical protein
MPRDSAFLVFLVFSVAAFLLLFVLVLLTQMASRWRPPRAGRWS